MKGFRNEVDEGVDTLANKMEAFCLLAIIEVLEIEDPLEKGFVGVLELFGRDLALVDNLDTNDEFAIMLIVLLWKYPIEQTWP